MRANIISNSSEIGNARATGRGSTPVNNAVQTVADRRGSAGSAAGVVHFSYYLLNSERQNPRLTANDILHLDRYPKESHFLLVREAVRIACSNPNCPSHDRETTHMLEAMSHNAHVKDVLLGQDGADLLSAMRRFCRARVDNDYIRRLASGIVAAE